MLTPSNCSFTASKAPERTAVFCVSSVARLPWLPFRFWACNARSTWVYNPKAPRLRSFASRASLLWRRESASSRINWASSRRARAAWACRMDWLYALRGPRSEKSHWDTMMTTTTAPASTTSFSRFCIVTLAILAAPES